jgi:hypothetical protein
LKSIPIRAAPLARARVAGSCTTGAFEAARSDAECDTPHADKRTSAPTNLRLLCIAERRDCNAARAARGLLAEHYPLAESLTRLIFTRDRLGRL